MTSKPIYVGDKPLFGLSWCENPGVTRLAASTFAEGSLNEITIVDYVQETGEMRERSRIGSLKYPATKIMWAPGTSADTQRLASVGDRLRLYREQEDQWTVLLDLVNVRKSTQHLNNSPAPMTSFDWNRVDPRHLLTSSIDTTCTLWDLEAGKAKTQLIAHDKQVFDVAYNNSVDCFASVGADGSLRMFDLRALDHSSILYETSRDPLYASHLHSASPPGLHRVRWNQNDHGYLATFGLGSSMVHIIDVRNPGKAVVTLMVPSGSLVSSICWKPGATDSLLVSATDDVLYVWDHVTSKQPSLFHDMSSINRSLPMSVGCRGMSATAVSSSHANMAAVAYGEVIEVLSLF